MHRQCLNECTRITNTFRLPFKEEGGGGGGGLFHESHVEITCHFTALAAKDEFVGVGYRKLKYLSGQRRNIYIYMKIVIMLNIASNCSMIGRKADARNFISYLKL